MARKPFLSAALIGLLALSQATPGLAEIYDLPSAAYAWTETFPLDGSAYTPGAIGSMFSGRHKWGNDGLWQIGGDYSYNAEQSKFQINSPVTNKKKAQVSTDSINWFYTFVYTYDDIVTEGKVRFIANIPGGPSITSIDAEFKISATYIFDSTKGVWTFQNNQTGEYVATIEGSGKNINGSPFTISGIIWEDYGDHTHSGHFINFQLTYGPSPVPIPGAVWLLGTGLLGLFSLKRRWF